MRFLLGLVIGYSIRGKQRLLIATLATLVFIVFVVLPAIALSQLALSVKRERQSRPSQTIVPTVIGLTYQNAEIKLRVAHLNPRLLARRDNATLESGIIISQTPQPGERVDYQTTIGVTIAQHDSQNAP